MDTRKIKEIKGIKEIRNGGKVIWRGDPFGDLPGPKELIGGNLQAGFYGECPTSEFITGDGLAKLIGLTAGKSQHSTEPWLKFSYMGNVEYVAKKPFRCAISWDNINGVNAVFGNRTVKIGEYTYKIRLMKGKTEGKQGDKSSYSGSICFGSEWNKLLLPIHKNAPSSWKHPANVNSPTEDWGIRYSNDDLITNYDNGCWAWCQEYGDSDTKRLIRGYDGVSRPGCNDPSGSGYYCGWRPVLEFVK